MSVVKSGQQLTLELEDEIDGLLSVEASDQPLEIKQSHEYAVQIINAIESNEPARANINPICCSLPVGKI